MFRRRQESTTPARSSPRVPDSGPARPAGARGLLTRLPHLALLIVSLLLAGAFAGCGDDGDTTTGGSDTSPASTTATAPENGGEATPEPATGDGKGGVAMTEIGSFDTPVYVAQPPGSKDLYVVEQGGKIIRVEQGGKTSEFLDISGEIVAGGEQGLLSVAFAPDFQRSGLLYVDFTDTEGDTRVAEFTSEDDGATAAPDSRRDLLRIDQPFSNHNGGLLQFGDDGLLYIGTGDGGSAGDPDRNAQDTGSLLGKILRIDPQESGERPYKIPAGNPYADESGARGEIFALGLRNPWRYSFDRSTGALAIGDVGQDTLEEVDLVSAKDANGANFGWSAFEGVDRFNDDQQAPDAVPPVLTYPTSGDNCSVTGGYVVRDTELKSLYGRYLYGDFCAGELRSFTAEPGQQASDDRALGLDVENLSSFGEDQRGKVYAVSLSGPVYRLDPAA